jgi:PPM family protein phosphatase
MAERFLDWNNALQYAALTDIGMRRSNNQDAHVVVLASDFDAWKSRGHFFMVADGMGAHAAGELASKLAVEGVSHLYHKYAELSAPEALQKAMLETNAKVHQRGQANADFRNMGTTASTLVLLPQGAFVAHIGDSRIYRLRESRLEQLTFDHSLVWELRAAGQLNEDAELSHSIPKNVITRSLGPNSTVQVDIEGPLPLHVGDIFLLCSDGLTGRLSDEELAGIMSALPPFDAAQMLIDLANLRGGQDNITLVIAKVVDPALVTADDTSDPIKIGARADQPVHPAIWATLVVCILLSLVLLLTHNPLPAMIAATGGLIALIVGFVVRHRGRTPGVALGNGRRLGKGPYAQVNCPPIELSLQKLATFARDLRNSSAAANLKIDWADYDRLCQEAAGHAQSSRHREAMHAYARAVRSLMQAIRESQNSEASDSSIEL